MMWNWLVSGLAARRHAAALRRLAVRAGGNILFDFADAERHDRVRHLGQIHRRAGQARAASRADTHKLDSAARHALDRLAAGARKASITSTTTSNSDLQLASISGGTDIVSCFALGNPLLPVWRGEMQCRGLGMKVEVFDDAGQPVRGEKGELVCTAPFPSMPVGFWNDPDGAKYRAAYFERFPERRGATAITSS